MIWFTYIVSTDSQLDVAGELALVGFLIFTLELLHVLGDVLAEDVLTVNSGVEALLLSIVAWEALDGVGDVETTVDGALHGSENASSSGGASQTDVQVATEGSWAVIDWLDEVFLTGDVSLTAVECVESQLVENATSDEQTSAVSCSVVGQTDLDAISRQLVRVSGADDAISFNACISDLTGDVAVAQTNDETVLGRIILVLILEDKTLASLVVGTALATSLKLNLVPLEVLLVLDDFHETHFKFVCSWRKRRMEKFGG